MKALVKKILKTYFYKQSIFLINKYYELESKYLIQKGRVPSRYKKEYSADKLEYNRLNQEKQFVANDKYDFPIYFEKNQPAGTMGVYFWQDLWAASLIAKENPAVHFDIGSRVDGFIAHLASFRENINLIDIRPLKQEIPGVKFVQGDATNLENIGDETIESLSALCSLEHFGLGRYGDKIDPLACFKAFETIQRVIQRNGRLYISVPIGEERVEFNAHRIFNPNTILEKFDKMELLEFSTVSGVEDYIRYNDNLERYAEDADNKGGVFGLFAFVKP